MTKRKAPEPLEHIIDKPFSSSKRARVAPGSISLSGYLQEAPSDFSSDRRHVHLRSHELSEEDLDRQAQVNIYKWRDNVIKHMSDRSLEPPLNIIRIFRNGVPENEQNNLMLGPQELPYSDSSGWNVAITLGENFPGLTYDVLKSNSKRKVQMHNEGIRLFVAKTPNNRKIRQISCIQRGLGEGSGMINFAVHLAEGEGLGWDGWDREMNVGDEYDWHDVEDVDQD